MIEFTVCQICLIAPLLLQEYDYELYKFNSNFSGKVTTSLIQD